MREKFLESYLTENIYYGGELMPRWKVIKELEKVCADQRCIDRWLQGYDLAQSLEAKRGNYEDFSC
jgi:hypothetical protein